MARQLNGTSQAFSIASGATAPEVTGDLSVAVRYRTNDTFTGQMVIDASSGPDTAGWRLSMGTQSADRFTLWSYGSSFAVNIKSGADIPEDAAWHTLVVIADSVGGGVKFFVDGVDTGNTGNTYAGVAAGSGATKYIGQNISGAQWWNGGLAELAVWNAVLTDAEAVSYAKGASPLLIRPSLRRCYWPLIGRVSPEPELVAGANATLVSTPTAADHPAVFYPALSLFSPDVAGSGGGPPPVVVWASGTQVRPRPFGPGGMRGAKASLQMGQLQRPRPGDIPPTPPIDVDRPKGSHRPFPFAPGDATKKR